MGLHYSISLLVRRSFVANAKKASEVRYYLKVEFLLLHGLLFLLQIFDFTALGQVNNKKDSSGVFSCKYLQSTSVCVILSWKYVLNSFIFYFYHYR